jgi:hypothetical protein
MTELDNIAFRLYIEAYKKDPQIWGFDGINDSFISDIEGFVRFRKQDNNNLLTYYQKANIKLRKKKLNKLKINEAEN